MVGMMPDVNDCREGKVGKDDRCRLRVSTSLERPVTAVANPVAMVAADPPNGNQEWHPCGRGRDEGTVRVGVGVGVGLGVGLGVGGWGGVTSSRARHRSGENNSISSSSSKSSSAGGAGGAGGRGWCGVGMQHHQHHATRTCVVSNGAVGRMILRHGSRSAHHTAAVYLERARVTAT